MDIPDCFYRVSIKALILDESRTKFLVTQQEDGFWDLPGGGLDWGVLPQDDLRREIMEEMGLSVTWVAEHPCYFFADKGLIEGGWWRGNVMYEATLEHLQFTPSDECVAVRFVTAEEAKALAPQVGSIAILGGLFDPARHV